MKLEIVPSKETIRLVNKVRRVKLVEPKRKTLKLASDIFRSTAIKKAPVRKGALRKSIMDKVHPLGKWAKVFSKLKYAPYQEYGTGIYGSRRAYITPKRAKMLVWRNRAGKLIFARKVRGVKPKKFFKAGSEMVAQKTAKLSAYMYNELRRVLYV